MTYQSQLQIYIGTLDDTIDNVGTLGAKVDNFSGKLKLASNVIKAIDKIGDLADSTRKSIDTELTVLKLTKLAGPLKIPSKIFEKILKTMKPVVEKIDKAVDKLNGKKDANGLGDEEDGEFLKDLSGMLNKASLALGVIADELQNKARDMYETRQAASEFVSALDHASFAEYDALKTQVETQIADRNAVTAPLAQAFSDVTSSVNGVLGIISDAKFELVTQDIGDFAQISDILNKIGEPLNVVAAIIKPIEGLLNAVGFLVDLVLGPVFDFITKTLGIDKLIQGVADDIKALLPDADFLDPLVNEVQALMDSVREFNISAFGINDLLDDIDARLIGSVGDASMGPTGIGDDSSETLSGDSGDDILDARGGDDVVFGGAGNDILVAGEGNDTYLGGDGSDMVYFSGYFNEYELARNADSKIVITHVRPAAGKQNEGTTVLDSIEHVVFLNISFTGNELDNAIIGGSVLNGTNNDDLMFLNLLGTINADGQHVVFGWNGNDRIFGSTGNDELNGGDGDDVLIPGQGNDEANGGSGSDSYQILDSGSNTGVRVDMVTGMVFGNEGTDTLRSVENLILQGNGDHYITGNSANNNLLTAGGDDVIGGGAGNDFFNTSDGKDAIITGAGRDRVQSGDNNDLILAASRSVAGQNEFFDGGRGYDILSYSRDLNLVRDLFSPEIDKQQRIKDELNDLTGDTGSLRIFAATGKIEKLDANGAVIATDTAQNIEVFVGSDNDDVLFGARASFQNTIRIHGAGGNDTLYSNGASQISGGEGDDRLLLTTSGPGAVDGIFDGGNGHDVLDLRQAGEVRWWLSLVGSISNSGVAYDNDYVGNMRGSGSTVGRINVYDINEFLFADGAHVIDNDPLHTGPARTFRTGKGDDQLYHKSGYAIFDAGDGDDFARLESWATVFGGSGDDRMVFDHTGTGNEAYGESGNDWVTLERFQGSTANGGNGYDTLLFDTLDFGVSVDLRVGTIAGIGANSRIDATVQSFERVVGSEFNDTIKGRNNGDETLIGRQGNDHLNGNGGADQLFGGSGNDTLIGGSGNDRLHGGAGNDILKGGKGRDTAVYSNFAPDGLDAALTAGSFGGVTVNLTLGVATGSFGTDTLFGIQDVIGSAGGDSLGGNKFANVLSGEAGDDMLFGLRGNDVLILGAGSDTAFGGEGNDHIIVGAGSNMVDGGNGKDRMEFGPESGQITLNFRTDSFSGTLNTALPVWQDTGTTESRIYNGVSLTPQMVKETQALYADSADDLTRILPDADSSLAGLFRIVDKLTPTQIQGQFSSIETVIGGNAAVNILLSTGFDRYDGTRSDGDILDFSATTSGIRFNIATGSTNYNRAKGDDLRGIDGVIGGSGNDWFGGDNSNNTLVGKDGADTLLGSGGDDKLYGRDGRDDLSGGLGADKLWGGKGKDALAGGKGKDALTGGTGKDTLTGGSGKDMFVFARGDDRDKITDFKNNTDLLVLSSFDFASVNKALSNATNVNGNTVFNFGSGDVLTLFDITKAALADDILI